MSKAAFRSASPRFPALRASLLLAFASLASTPALALYPAPDAGASTECLFNWAEKQYPDLFQPAGAASKIRDGYVYREYANTGTRLAAGTGRLWLLAAGADQLANAGNLPGWYAASGCGGADTTAPQVIYTSRSADAVEVALNSRVSAAFSEPVSASGSLDRTLVVTGEDGKAVAGKVSYDDEEAILYFTPKDEFKAGRSYSAKVSGLRDLAGNPLPEYSWSFRASTEGRRNGAVEQELQEMLDRALWRWDIPGATMAVLNKDGSLWTTASGYADISQLEPMTDDHRFRVGSNTKTMVATEVLRLVDEGKVVLDAPINTYLADFMAYYLPSYDGNKITVRHLLNHTSGMVNFTADPEWGSAFISDPVKTYFPQELLMIAERNADHSPAFGSFAYSNTNYVLLGLLIGRVSGLSYEESMREKIAVPLDLPQTFAPLIGEAQPPEGSSHGYWEDTETALFHDVSVKDASTTWSSGNVVSDIDDMAHLVRGIGRGTLLSPATQAERLKYIPMNDHLEYGLGLVRDVRTNMFGHQGGIIGYTSQMYYVVDEDASIAFFYNRTLALSDYSDVMTYDAIKLLWPERYGELQVNPLPAPAADGLQAGNKRASAATPLDTRSFGMLNEY